MHESETWRRQLRFSELFYKLDDKFSTGEIMNRLINSVLQMSDQVFVCQSCTVCPKLVSKKMNVLRTDLWSLDCCQFILYSFPLVTNHSYLKMSEGTESSDWQSTDSSRLPVSQSGPRRVKWRLFSPLRTPVFTMDCQKHSDRFLSWVICRLQLWRCRRIYMWERRGDGCRSH